MLNRYIAQLLLQIDKDGYITRKTQKVYLSMIGFFIAMKWLKEKELIFNDGFDKNNFKIWKLTKKGKEVVECLKKIEELTK
ncbi:MAG: hypothetical protein QW795_03500 [Candidatus Bathyarchaeia archaeon]